MNLYYGEEKGEGKASLYKGCAESPSKPRQRGNSHDWVEELDQSITFSSSSKPQLILFMLLLL